MSATLQPGAVCASLDNGRLFVVDSIAGDFAVVRPIEDPKVPPIECPAIAALQHVRACYQRHFDAMPVAWQTVDDIAADAINQAAGMPSAGVLFACCAG